ncbi:MAG TPA: methyltransferase domain-containing protein [Thermoanaerobaculia bacterium]|nr:methyltransferase domain-containing protein [Thermoanaerobaculia bacterium]
MKRIDEPELLDEHDAPRADMERSLRDLRRINKYLGGRSIYRRLLRAHGAHKSVIDIGTGTSDLLEQISGFRVGVDFKIEHLRYFRDARIHRVVGDALHLPFRDNAADVVTSAHFFHHFSPDQNAQILNESLRVAKKGVVVNDTRRHVLPLIFILLLCAIRVFGRITRSDAPGSIRRGYTIDEVRGIVAKTDAAKKSIVRAWPFRFGILLWK